MFNGTSPHVGTVHFILIPNGDGWFTFCHSSDPFNSEMHLLLHKEWEYCWDQREERRVRDREREKQKVRERLRQRVRVWLRVREYIWESWTSASCQTNAFSIVTAAEYPFVFGIFQDGYFLSQDYAHSSLLMQVETHFSELPDLRKIKTNTNAIWTNLTRVSGASFSMP